MMLTGIKHKLGFSSLLSPSLVAFKSVDSSVLYQPSCQNGREIEISLEIKCCMLAEILNKQLPISRTAILGYVGQLPSKASLTSPLIKKNPAFKAVLLKKRSACPTENREHWPLPSHTQTAWTPLWEGQTLRLPGGKGLSGDQDFHKWPLAQEREVTKTQHVVTKLQEHTISLLTAHYEVILAVGARFLLPFLQYQKDISFHSIHHGSEMAYGFLLFSLVQGVSFPSPPWPGAASADTSEWCFPMDTETSASMEGG